MFEQEYDALNWLCEKSKFPRIYASLRWGIHRYPKSKQYQACAVLAGLLRDEKDIVRRMIHHHDWRNQVIGNMVVVLNCDSHFEDDYVKKLASENVHFPESLAAGWAFINTGKTIPRKETFLRDMGERKDIGHASVPYHIAISVYAALRILSSNEAIAFETTPLFTELKSSSFFLGTIDHTEHNYANYKSFNSGV